MDVQRASAPASLGGSLPRAALVLSIVALVVSGCQAAGHSATVTTTTVPATTTTTIVPPDAAQLTAIVFQSSDLPANWTETAPGDSDTGNNDDGVIDSEMAECAGVPDIGSDEVANADSGTFALGVNMIGSSATSYVSPADITATDAVFNQPKIKSCIQSVLVSGLVGSGASVRDALTTLNIGPGAGPPNVVATATSTFTLVTSRIGVPCTVNLVFMTGPLVVGAAFFFGAGAPISPSLEAAAVAKMAARTAAAP